MYFAIQHINLAYFSASNINGVGHLLRPFSRRKYFISLVLKESIICFDFITCFFIILNLFTPPPLRLTQYQQFLVSVSTMVPW